MTKTTIVTLPSDQWDILAETLEMDAESSMFDIELRKEIQDALISLKTEEVDTSVSNIENIENIVTIQDFWDCECDEDYIHPKAQPVCGKCATFAGDMPDSRLDEVIKMFTKRANDQAKEM